MKTYTENPYYPVPTAPYTYCFALLEQSPDGATYRWTDTRQTIRMLAVTSSPTGLYVHVY